MLKQTFFIMYNISWNYNNKIIHFVMLYLKKKIFEKETFVLSRNFDLSLRKLFHFCKSFVIKISMYWVLSSYFQVFKNFKEGWFTLKFGDKIIDNSRDNCFWQNFEFRHAFTLLPLIRTWTQWNLSMADIPYIGHLFTTDTFLKNGWNDGETLITKSLCSGHL